MAVCLDDMSLDLLCVPAWLCRRLLDSQYSYPVWPLGSRWLSGLMSGGERETPFQPQVGGNSDGQNCSLAPRKQREIPSGRERETKTQVLPGHALGGS